MTCDYGNVDFHRVLPRVTQAVGRAVEETCEDIYVS